MGILISGAHGLAGAKADPMNSGFGRDNQVQSVFAKFTSGTDWIRQTAGLCIDNRHVLERHSFLTGSFCDSILTLNSFLLLLEDLSQTMEAPLLIQRRQMSNESCEQSTRKTLTEFSPPHTSRCCKLVPSHRNLQDTSNMTPIRVVAQVSLKLMIKQEEKQTIHEWIQKILQEAGKSASQSHEHHNLSNHQDNLAVSAEDKTCMDVHKDILLLEGYFQASILKSLKSFSFFSFF